MIKKENDFTEERKKIDEINRQIEELLEERFRLTNEIGMIKKNCSIDVEDREREKFILNPCEGRIYDYYIREIKKEILYNSKKEQDFLKYPSFFLVGMPGCGKSTLGKKIAFMLDIPFADTDRIIEHRENMTIEEIFKYKGEKYFREVEKELVRELPRGFIVALGGGTPLFYNNLDILKKKGYMIYINKSLWELKNQILTGRPLMASPEDTEKLYNKRHSFFIDNSDFVFEDMSDYEYIFNICEKIKNVRKDY